MKSDSELSYDTLLKACNSGDVNKVRSVITRINYQSRSATRSFRD